MMSEGSKTPTINDAKAYLKEVKDVFQDKKEIFYFFLNFLRDFKERRVDAELVKKIVKDLFKEHTDLIVGFNAFLPAGYEIKLPLEDESPPRVGYAEAVNFVIKLKTRFHGNYHVYRSFADIMTETAKGKKSITEVYQEVTPLFQGHEDLFQELTHFFPVGTSGAAST